VFLRLVVYKGACVVVDGLLQAVEIARPMRALNKTTVQALGFQRNFIVGLGFCVLWGR
jgi:hypothetical protein